MSTAAPPARHPPHAPGRGAVRLVVVALALVTAACWAWLVTLSLAMDDGGSRLAMPMSTAWSGADAVVMSSMWAVMMAAMMLPSATPMIAAYARTAASPRAGVHGSTTAFVAGYLVLWAGVGLLGTGLQWLLHDAALVDASGSATSRWLAGSVLLLAGGYQLTGVKHTMLGRCRSPLGFLLAHWRDGRAGALRMGLRHGVVCLGCCWALMLLLFVLGVMNLAWVAVLAAVVLVEKVTGSEAVPRAVGVAALAASVLVLAGVA